MQTLPSSSSLSSGVMMPSGSTPAVTRGRFLNCGRTLTTFRSWEGSAVTRSGFDEVSELLTAAAKTLNYETWSAENLAAGSGDTFGFTVELERLTRQISGKTEEMRLRATSISGERTAPGRWSIVTVTVS